MTAVVLAKSSSCCPLCSTYIASNQSEISPLPEAIYPRTMPGDSSRSFDTGQCYAWDATPPMMTPRKWAHRDCVPLYLERLAEGRDDEPLWLDGPATRSDGGNTGEQCVSPVDRAKIVGLTIPNDLPLAEAVLNKDGEWFVKRCPFCDGQHVHPDPDVQAPDCDSDRTYRVVDRFRLIATTAGPR